MAGLLAANLDPVVDRLAVDPKARFCHLRDITNGIRKFSSLKI